MRPHGGKPGDPILLPGDSHLAESLEHRFARGPWSVVILLLYPF